MFKKLEVLLKSQINDVLRGDPTRQPMPRNPQRKVTDLRERINKAIEHEDELQQQVAALRSETKNLDAEADTAVKRGDEATARHILAQLQRTQQRLSMVESDLEAHRLVAQELILNVNRLEAALADQRRTEPQPTERTNDIFQETQSRIAELGERLGSRRSQVETSLEVEKTQDEEQIEDDLEARRNRLSKR